MEDFSKEMEYGNFQDFDRFPLDCESIAMMQSTLRHYAAIAQIAGYDLLILSGCEVSGGFREEGYVFVKKNGTLTGEILFHPKAVQQSTCSISEIKYDVQADGETFENAYSKRRLIEGGNEFSWTEIVNLSSVSNKALFSKLYSLSNSLSSEQSARDAAVQKLKETSTQYVNSQISTLTEKINTEITQRTAAVNNIEKSIVPKGVILMWYGDPNQVPEGWVLCDGRIYNGIKIPDLRNRFVVGAGSGYELGGSYGSNYQSITLGVNNLPSHGHTVTMDEGGSHSHTFKDYYYAEGQMDKTNSDYHSINNRVGSGDTDTDNDYLIYYKHFTEYDGSHKHDITCGNTGNGKPFLVNTMPYSIALYYIMKV